MRRRLRQYQAVALMRWGLVVLGLLLGRPAWAECEGILEGEVVDAETQSALVGARVLVPDQVRVAETDGDGKYRLEGLCEGEFRVEVRKQGYAPHVERFGIHNHVNQHDFFLVPSTVERVEVQGEAVSDAERGPQALETLEGDALSQVRGEDLARSLDSLAGVRVLGSGAVGKPVVNGLTGNRLLILQDGVRHESQDWGLDHAPEIDPFSAGRIEVVKGAAGVRYGPRAIGGAILLHSPEYPEAPGVTGEGNLVGIANGGGGAASLATQLRLKHFGSDHRGPSLALRGQVSGKKHGTLRTPRYFLGNTSLEEWAGSGGARLDVGRHFIEADYRGFQTNYGLFFGIGASDLETFEQQIEADLPNGVESFGFTYDLERPFVGVGHSLARGRAHLQLSDSVNLDLLYAFQNDDRREFDQTRRASRERPQATFQLQTHFVEAVAARVRGPSETRLGVSGQIQSNEYFGSLPFIPDYGQLAGSVFALQRWVQDRFELEGGLRVDASQFDYCVDARSEFAEGLPSDRDRCDADRRLAQRDFVALTFALGGAFEFGQGWTFRTSAGSAVRNPAPNELFVDGVSIGVAAIERGDPSLGNEITYNVQGEVSYGTESVALSASAYAHYVDGYIYATPEFDETGAPIAPLTSRGRFPLFQYRQIDALFAGLDAEIAIRPQPWMELKSQLSLVRGSDLTNASFVLFVPGDRIRTRLTMGPPDRPLLQDAIYLESLAVLQQTRFDPAADFLEPPASYHLLNLGVKARFHLGPQPVDVSVDVQNLTNEVYREYLSRLRYYADEPGIRGFLRLSVPFEVPFEGVHHEEENH